MKNRIALTVTMFLMVPGMLPAQNWPGFLGPEGNGVLDNVAHPLEWSNDKNMAWSIDLPGGGLSSPVVYLDRIFLTTAIGPSHRSVSAKGFAICDPKSLSKPCGLT